METNRNTIIYVDDDLNYSWIYEKVLTEAGYDVFHFADPLEALDHT